MASSRSSALDAPRLRSAFQALDRLLDHPVTLVVGDGTARQASRDLRDAPFLEREGRTRSARYRLREPRAADAG